ncbi:MAG: PAS domain-containing protein, partial [Pseudobdellovibrionaceae bacterium]|nr:PAS domain-containing protein [Pseudobdellovibrionaceae bacterium]
MPSPNLRFLDGNSELAKHFREKDCSHHPLGSPESWPQELKTFIALLLSSMFPMWVAWGKERIFFYNDATAEIMGRKHSSALGEKLEVVWPEIWAELSPVVDKVDRGESILVEDIQVPINRYGHNEKLSASFSCSPIRNESGEVAGIFCTVTQTTKRHRAVERERLYRALMDAPVIIGVHRGEDLIMEFANTLYRKAVGATDDILEKPLVEATPSIQPEVVANLRNVFHTGVPFRLSEAPILLDYDNTGTAYEKIWNVIYQPLHGVSGEVESVMTCCIEVTEQVKARKVLQRESHRLDQIFRSSPAAMALWTGQDMVFEMANPGFQALVQNIDLLG